MRVAFEPDEIARSTLLEVFFTCHDPTQLNRQGNDVGPQYRSIVLYADQGQREDALAAIEGLSEAFYDPIVTEVEPLGEFWVAEDHHHDYFANNPQNPYCRTVVSPKLAKVRAKFSHLYG